MSNKNLNLVDRLPDLLNEIMGDDRLLGILDKVLKNQPLMDIVGGVYKASLLQMALPPILQTTVSIIEAILPPDDVGSLFDNIDSFPEGDKIMEEIWRIVVLAFNNLAPSKGLV
ncbi:MAG: hypothetical protein MOIL_01509 [Candidatus Methanolliviera sp. GoM_oil]|nr:MAG: hypothetical protein MOIL_01509 [Candidatus Methanolliviera sp. GoM_oil]